MVEVPEVELVVPGIVAGKKVEVVVYDLLEGLILQSYCTNHLVLPH